MYNGTYYFCAWIAHILELQLHFDFHTVQLTWEIILTSGSGDAVFSMPSLPAARAFLEERILHCNLFYFSHWIKHYVRKRFGMKKMLNTRFSLQQLAKATYPFFFDLILFNYWMIIVIFEILQIILSSYSGIYFCNKKKYSYIIAIYQLFHIWLNKLSGSSESTHNYNSDGSII